MFEQLTWNNNNVDAELLRLYPNNELVYARVVLFTQDLTNAQKQQLQKLGVYVNETEQQRISYYAGFRAGLTYERLKELFKLTAPISVPNNKDRSWQPYNVPADGKLVARIMLDRQRHYPAGNEPYSEPLILSLAAEVLRFELVGWLRPNIVTGAKGRRELQVSVINDKYLIEDAPRFTRQYSRLVVNFAKKAHQSLTTDVVERQLIRTMAHEFSDEVLAPVCQMLKTIKKISYAGVTTRTPGPNLP